MERYGFIYKLTYLPTKKIYIGRHKINGDENYLGSGSIIKDIQSKDKKRLRGDLWRKLWTIDILCYGCNSSILNKLEYYWIDKLNSSNPDIGYNILTNDIIKDKDWPTERKEVREKISKSHIGSRNPMYGKHHSDEVKKIIGKYSSGRKLSEEAREKIRNKRTGLKLTDDTKRKLSEINSGSGNPNYGKRGSETSMYGKHHSEEFKKRHSDRMKGSGNPMFGKPSPNKGKKMSEEQKQKIRMALIGRKRK